MTLLTHISGWLADVVEQVGSVSVPLLFLALTLQTGQTLLNATAWWNVLRAAYPAARPGVPPGPPSVPTVAVSPSTSFLLGPEGGTVAMLALFRRRIKGATVLFGLLGAALVQSLFFIVVGSAIWAGLLASRPEIFHLKYEWLPHHPALAVAVALAGIVVARVAVAALPDTTGRGHGGRRDSSTRRRRRVRRLGLQFAGVRPGMDLLHVHAGLRHSGLPRLRAARDGRQRSLVHVLGHPRRCGDAAGACHRSPSGTRPRATPWPGTRSVSS